MSMERAALGRMLEQFVDLGVMSSAPSRLTPSSSGDSRPSGPAESARTVIPALSTAPRGSGVGAVSRKPPTPEERRSTTRNSPPASSSSPSSSMPIPSSASIRSRRRLTVPTKPSSRRSAMWRPRSCGVFCTVWERVDRTGAGPTQADETQQVCSGSKGQDPPRDGVSRGRSPEGGRTRWT